MDWIHDVKWESFNIKRVNKTLEEQSYSVFFHIFIFSEMDVNEVVVVVVVELALVVGVWAFAGVFLPVVVVLDGDVDNTLEDVIAVVDNVVSKIVEVVPELQNKVWCSIKFAQ